MNRPFLLTPALGILLFASSCKKDEKPEVPVLQLPVNGATSVSHFPTFQWNSSKHADEYEIQVSTSGSDFSGGYLKDGATTGSTSYKNTSLYYGNNVYYWRVRAINGDAESGWSEVRLFVVDSNSPDEPGPVFGTIMFYDPTLASGLTYEISISLHGPQQLDCAGGWPSDCNAPASCGFTRFTGIYSTTYYVTVEYATGPNTGQTAFSGSVYGSLGSCQRINVHDL
ncbi:MAG: hypothetical protein ABI432_11675 [Flavobacteriales bacterium]